MKKIGLTSGGVVIVEMTPAEFDTAERALGAKAQAKLPFTPSYILPRLLKSKPTTRGAVAHFITAMFQFQDGASSADVERMVTKLEEAKAVRFDDAGKAIYQKPNQVPEPTSGSVTPRADARVAPPPPVAHR